MVAQRGQGTVAPSAPKPSAVKPKTEAMPTASAARRKLGFNEQHELRTLPARIAELEERIGKITAALADPTLYARDSAMFERLSAALSAAQRDLSAAEDRWLALEVLREGLEG